MKKHVGKKLLLITLLLSVILLLNACAENVGPSSPVISNMPGISDSGSTGNTPDTGDNGPGEGDNDPDQGGNVPGEGDNDPDQGGNVPGEGDNDPDQGGSAPGEGGSAAPDHTHAYGAWQITKEATCSEDGSQKRLCSCGAAQTESIPVIPHTVVSDPAAAPTCTADGKTDGSHCSVCQLIIQAPTVIPATGHTAVTDPGTPADCTTDGKTEGSHCSVCQDVITPQKTIPATGHTAVTVTGKAPTDTEPGLTDGKNCSVCGAVIVAQEQISPYLIACNDDYAYQDLGRQTNGSAKQALYSQIDTQAKRFHTDSTVDAQGDVAFIVSYSDLGLSTDDALAVWLCYKNDHPLFYWISGSVNFDTETLSILTDSAYAKGSTRIQYNKQLYTKIAAFAEAAAGETSAYQIALAYHDAIIQAIDYAYEDDLTTPETDLWAHSIVGVFDKKGGVCEAYSRAFQLLLNLRGIDNIFVSGVGGSEQDGVENHAWNLIKLDDGQWYWCDLTWDDRPGWEWGIIYNYFCVNDTQDTNWYDSFDPQPPISFMEQHRPMQSVDSQINYQITLPDRASGEFAASPKPLVRDTFTVSGLTYSVVGYRTLQLIGVNTQGALTIPEKVTYKNDRYTVISVGTVREDGLFTEGQVVIENTSVSIPKSLKFIWDSALAGSYVERYTVDDANPYFSDLNGVLFTKSLYTLIQYPYSAPAADKYVIPDATGRIAKGSLNGISSPLGELVLGKNVEFIGYANWGEGYTDVPITEGFLGNMVMGELSMLMERKAFDGDFAISVSPENPYYKAIDGVIYGCNEGVPVLAVCSASTTVRELTLADGVLEIEASAFFCCKNLTAVSLPNSIERIQSGAFASMNLTTITYRGTVSEWNNVMKMDNWDKYDPTKPAITVVCTDGTV